MEDIQGTIAVSGSREFLFPILKDFPSKMFLKGIVGGDTKITWNSANQDEIDAAKAAFEKLRAKRFKVYKVTRAGGAGEEVFTFDPKAEAYIAIPQYQGG